MDNRNSLERALDLIASDRSPHYLTLSLGHRECAMLRLAQRIRGLLASAPTESFCDELMEAIRARRLAPEEA